ncbi:glycosyltransferase family 4 protein [Phocaeicola sp.]
MRILYIIDKMHHFAGMERILSCRLNYLSEHTDYELYISTYEQSGKDLPFALNESVHYLPIDVPIANRERLSFLKWLGRFYASRRAFYREFTDLMEEVNPDIVVGTVYSFPVVDVMLEVACKRHKHFVLESHTKASTVLLSAKGFYNKWVCRICGWMDRYILNSLVKADAVVSLTEADAAFWRDFSKRVLIIPNMITIRPREVESYQSKVVVSAGRFSYEKGYDRLIKAWSLLAAFYSDWQLLLVGNGDTEEYDALIHSYGLSAVVHCLPATEHIEEIYAKASVYAMGSRYEGFGLVLTEAMSCGLPCVSFDCPYGPAEIINDGEDGFLVPDNHVEAFADTLCRLMADESLRERMGRKALINVKRFDTDNVMKCWMDFYKAMNDAG